MPEPITAEELAGIPINKVVIYLANGDTVEVIGLEKMVTPEGQVLGCSEEEKVKWKEAHSSTVKLVEQGRELTSELDDSDERYKGLEDSDRDY